MSTTIHKTDKDTLHHVERVLEMLVVVMMLALYEFFAAHQRQDTGFFTSGFGIIERACLYGPILFALIPPIIRASTGRKNPGRLWDAAAKVCLAAGSLWLLLRFPFDYRHLGDVMPGASRFLFLWVTDGIARIILLIQVITEPLGALKDLWDFFRASSQESESQARKAA